MTRPEPLSRQVALVATRAALVWLRRAERSVARKVRHYDESMLAPHRLTINVVDDPAGRMQLIGVRGPVTLATVGALNGALDAVGDWTALHLDVTDAVISGPEVLDQVERIVDQLELRGVRIRIIGLDPRHPALSSQRPR